MVGNKLKVRDFINIEPCNQIRHPKGNLIKLLSCKDLDFKGFGELYLTSIKYGQTKGWKKHSKMFSTLFIVSGVVEFKFKTKHDECEVLSVQLSSEEPRRLQ